MSSPVRFRRRLLGLAVAVASLASCAGGAPELDPDLPLPLVEEGALLYATDFDSPAAVEGWVMEGPGVVEHRDGGMEMFSPDQRYHHVYWAPLVLPESFVAEWTVRNLDVDAGLCIVFFAATGRGGEDIFDPGLRSRDGTFTQYTEGDLANYHISYYADGKGDPQRETANLRRNPGFHHVQAGGPGVPLFDTAPHRVRLVKLGAHIAMTVDERVVVNWVDDGEHGAPHGGGRFGLRQMQWTRFHYSDLSIREAL